MFTRTLLIAALLAAPSALGAVVAKRDHQITFVSTARAQTRANSDKLAR
jgi:hypothetical protein